MNKKAWISRARAIDQEIAALIQAYEQTKAQTAFFPGDRHNTQLDDMRQTIDRHVDALINARTEIINAIMRLENQNQRLALLLREIDGMKWADVAAELYITPRHARRVYEKALSALEVPDG